MPRITFLLLALTSFFSIAQDYSFDKQWENLGPLEKPLENKRMSANGIGPVEFIHAHQKVEGLMLAGSLNGGLFYTTDGGKQWINAGSDDWDYSGVGAAIFHPANEKVWYASNVQINDNGGPGAMGHSGGIYRTRDGGINWEQVADKSSFINSEYLVIYGFIYHPVDQNRLYVYTSEGIYETPNSTLDNIKWSRVSKVGGWIYDMKFVNDKVVISTMQHGKWRVLVFQQGNWNEFESVSFIQETTDPIQHITLQPHKGRMLILVNYMKRSDELYAYDVIEKTHERVLKNQRVVFGHGRTMTLSPHNENELIVGYSTTMQMWDIPTKKRKSIRGGYHVDIEWVEYDPFDTTKIYLGTHGGVYTSTDHGQSWESTSKGLGIAEVEGFAVSKSDPNRIVIGCYHDGSSVRADFQKNGIYEWKCINGGDGLFPLQPSNDPKTVYTSNQFTGGGIYVSRDTGRSSINIHTKKGLRTSGWGMTVALHPKDQNLLFFNYTIAEGERNGCIELGRTTDPDSKVKPEEITNFRASHGIEKYFVFGIYNSEDYPDAMFLYLIDFVKQEDGSEKKVHRLFKTDDCTAEAEVVRNSWYELEIPRNDWIADVVADPKKSNRVYIAYVAGIPQHETTEDDNGFIYALKYKKSTNALKREIDICENIPYCFTGKFNIEFDGNGGVFFGTRMGIFYGDKKTLKGKRDWTKIGFGLPHCKIQGLHFDPKEKSLTVAAYGRGIWKYYL